MDDTNTQNHSDSPSAPGSSFFGARSTIQPQVPQTSLSPQPDEKLIEAPPVPEMIESVEEDGQVATPSTISPVTLSEESARISYTDAKVTEIPIEQIVPNPYQPRKTFDPVQLQELANSIAEHGVIQPLVVNQTERGYELVVGERRFRASQIAGLKMVPVIVKAGMQDQAKLEIALIENIQRQELNPIEEAMAYDKLMKSFGLTQEQVAKKVGKSRPAVANTVRLLNLPVEIQRALIEGKISEGHARAVLGLPGSERQLALFKMIIDQGMNVRQVEAKVRELLSRPRLESAGPADPKTQAMESELRSKLGTQVRIEKRGSGGKITIDFFSDQELSELVGKLEGHNNNNDYFTV